MRAARALVVVAAAVAVGAPLSACGGGGGGGSTTATGGGATSTAPAQTQPRTQATTGTGGAAATTLAAGRQAFLANGCSSCHTLAAAGASGTIGPDLDRALPGRSAAFIRQSIVDPNAYIAKGYSPNVMPQGFGQQLSPSDLAALVAFLHAKAGS